MARGARLLNSSPDPGRGHFERGIKSEYLEVLGPIFAHSVRPLLVNKDLWSLKLEEVFTFQLVCPLSPLAQNHESSHDIPQKSVTIQNNMHLKHVTPMASL